MNKDLGLVDPAQMTAMLRAEFLAMTPELGGASVTDPTQVWGAMIEFGHPEVNASLVVLADGSVSVYLSDGSGRIGCGLHPRVRTSARKLLQVAQTLCEACRPMSNFPMPRSDGTNFYLLTKSGVLGAQALSHDLDEGAVPLAELYYAAHGVIDMVELLGAGVDLVDEMKLIRVQVERASHHAMADDGVETERHIAHREASARGRVCRILPYAGNVARRSNS